MKGSEREAFGNRMQKCRLKKAEHVFVRRRHGPCDDGCWGAQKQLQAPTVGVGRLRQGRQPQRRSVRVGQRLRDSRLSSMLRRRQHMPQAVL